MGRDIRKKEINIKNIFSDNSSGNKNKEIFQDILDNKGIKIEKIISFGQTTPANKWLYDLRDEWVLLLQGKSELMFESRQRIKLKKGDYILIPAEVKHKVLYTSKRPFCIWLTIFIE